MAKKFKKYQCQFCGSETKGVEILIDDIFTYNEDTKEYEPTKFSDEFTHTGVQRCMDCDEEWTGK